MKYKILQLIPIKGDLFTQYQGAVGKIDYRKVYAFALVELNNGSQQLIPIDYYDLESGTARLEKGESYIGLTEDPFIKGKK